MTKHIEIKPMIIPVINHAYGIDDEFDITEKATVMFEEISYEIYRCSHGIVKYEQDSFVRVNTPIPTVPSVTGMSYGSPSYDELFHYLDWTKQSSVCHKMIAGFNGEFWTYSDLPRMSVPDIYRKWNGKNLHFNHKNVCLFESTESFLEMIVSILRHGLKPGQWPYTDDPRKWLSRLPEKYWGNIK